MNKFLDRVLRRIGWKPPYPPPFEPFLGSIPKDGIMSANIQARSAPHSDPIIDKAMRDHRITEDSINMGIDASKTKEDYLMEIGQLVRLKSGGPVMTVLGEPALHQRRHKYVTCVWVDGGGHPQEKDYPVKALELAGSASEDEGYIDFTIHSSDGTVRKERHPGRIQEGYISGKIQVDRISGEDANRNVALTPKLRAKDIQLTATPSEDAEAKHIDPSKVFSPRHLRALIDECIEKKQGNKEFALFGYSDGTWAADVGNPSSSVQLGESSGEVSVYGKKTPEEAVRALLEKLT